MTKLKGILVACLFLAITFLVHKISYYLYSLIIFKLVEKDQPFILSLINGEVTKEEKAMRLINDTQVLYILLGWLITLTLIFLVYRLSKQKPFEIISKRLGIINLLFSVIIGIGLVLITNGALNLIGAFINLPVIDYGLEGSLMKGMLFTLVVGVLTPIAEEIMYRGLIMGKLLEDFQPVGFAVVTQALAFSLSHFNLIQSVFVFPLGLLTGLAVAKTKSIWSGFVIHISFNLANLFLLGTESFATNIGQLIILFVLGIFLCSVGYEKLMSRRIKH